MPKKNEYDRAIDIVDRELRVARKRAEKSRQPKFGSRKKSIAERIYKDIGIIPEHLNG